jgi:MoxR-like ATPase
MSREELLEAMATVPKVHASEALLDYLQALIAATRSGQWFVEGMSPRAGIALLRVSRARALLAGRDHVTPDDLQALLPRPSRTAWCRCPAPGAGRREQVRAMVEAVALP